jgi:FtsH-binding integral membrane protein
LGISSFAVILMALFGISTTRIMTQSIIMLIWGIIGVIATMTMPKNKFAPDNSKNKTSWLK